MLRNKKTKIGIIGCGAIGVQIALFIDKKLGAYACLCGVADKDKVAAKRLQKKSKANPKIYKLDSLIKNSDLVIEAASIDAARFALKKVFTYRKDLILLSVGAIIDNLSILKKAKMRKVNIYIPSGALCGVDGLGAVSMGKINKIYLTTSKPPKGVIGADYLKRKKINLASLNKVVTVFKGRVNEAIKCFPKNINVAATLLIASAFKNVRVCIKADPKLKRNVHHILVDAQEAKLDISVQNIPSKANPKTSALTILSTKYLLTKIFSSFKIGS